jgi:hypothetical protein
LAKMDGRGRPEGDMLVVTEGATGAKKTGIRCEMTGCAGVGKLMLVRRSAIVDDHSGDGPVASVPQKKRNCGRSFDELLRRLDALDVDAGRAPNVSVALWNSSSVMTRKLAPARESERDARCMEPPPLLRKRPPRPMARMKPRIVAV